MTVDPDPTAGRDGPAGGRTWSPATAVRAVTEAVPPPAWSGAGGEGVVVALLDSGVDAAHADLAGRLVAFADLVGGRQEPYDDHGHGTHLAGIIAGSGAVCPAYRGLAPRARLAVVKVLDGRGEGRESLVIRGLEWCVRERSRLGIRIVNLSLGGGAELPWREDPLCQAAAAAWRAGLCVVTPAGNEGRDGPGTIRTPGITPHVITVGAAAADQRPAPFSSRGAPEGRRTKPDVVAPGHRLVGPRAAAGHLPPWGPEGGDVAQAYTVQAGSSVAAAVVSGLLALACGRLPTASADQLKAALLRAARDVGEAPDRQGVGLVDAPSLLAALEDQLELGARVLGQAPEGERGGDVLALRAVLDRFFGARQAPPAARFDRQAAAQVDAYCRAIGVRPFSDAFWAGVGAPPGVGLGRRVLELGSHGSDVVALQGRLSVLGYAGGAASGTFDRATGRAVAALQRRLGLAPTGEMTLETARALAGLALGARPLAVGSRGADVHLLQWALRRLGALADRRGVFGPATEAAVRRAQRVLGLGATGGADAAFLVRMGRRFPVRLRGEETPPGRENESDEA